MIRLFLFELRQFIQWLFPCFGLGGQMRRAGFGWCVLESFARMVCGSCVGMCVRFARAVGRLGHIRRLARRDEVGF